jgi:hypothetical protein
LLDYQTPIGQEDEVVLFRGSHAVGDLEGMELELEPFDIVPRPRVEVRSELRPVNGPGTFDLLLDDDVVARGVADGGTSGIIVVEPGEHSISVADADGDHLVYDAHVSCTHRADETEHHTDRTQVRTATRDHLLTSSRSTSREVRTSSAPCSSGCRSRSSATR